jgi:hypothetical protein
MEGNEEEVEEGNKPLARRYSMEQKTEFLDAGTYDLDQTGYNKLLRIVKNVEGYKPHGGKINRICIMCHKDKIFDCGVMKFKGYEDFMYYMKYFFCQKNLTDDEYKKSKEAFQKSFNEYTKSSIGDYNFKSIKFVCRECLCNLLKEDTGYNNIYNALHNGLSKKKQKDEHSESNNISGSEIQKNSFFINLPNEKSNEAEIIQLPKIQDNSLSHSIKGNKPKDSNSTLNFTNNQFVQHFGMNNLNNPLANTIMNPDFTQNSNLQLQDLDNMNITNIIMNFEQNKNLNMHSMMEELKKQFFSIQYYSLLQKLFISYVFKNLEIFLDQISQSHTLGERILSGMMSTVPKTEGMDSNSAKFFQSISDQLVSLKTINKYGFDLTNELNTNFEQLKNNGIRLFKSMDPNMQSNIVTNSQNLVNDSGISNMSNSSDVMKNLSNLMGQGTNNQNIENLLSNVLNKNNNQTQSGKSMPQMNNNMNQMGNIMGGNNMNQMLLDQLIKNKGQSNNNGFGGMPMMQGNNLIPGQNFMNSLLNSPNLMNPNPNMMNNKSNLINSQTFSSNNNMMNPLSQFVGLNPFNQMGNLSNQFSTNNMANIGNISGMPNIANLSGVNNIPNMSNLSNSMGMPFNSSQMQNLMNNQMFGFNEMNPLNSSQTTMNPLFMGGQNINPFMSNPLMQQMGISNPIQFGLDPFGLGMQPNLMNQNYKPMEMVKYNLI